MKIEKRGTKRENKKIDNCQSKIVNPRWSDRISLTVKMVFVVVFVGLVVWALLDQIQTDRIKSLFLSQLTERLAQKAEKDRLSLDHYIKTHHQSVRMFVRLQNFGDYVKKQKWSAEVPNALIQIKYYRRSPPWFPRRSILRTFAQPRYALLLDPQARVREVYQRRREPPPRSLLQPPPILLAKSHGQSYMTEVEGVPYVVTSEAFLDSGGRRQAILMLASPIDDEFLNAAIRLRPGQTVALLIPGENPRILTSSNLEDIPVDTPLETVKQKYIVTGKEFFDYGASDLEISLASFIVREEVEVLTKEVILKQRQEHTVMAFMFILSFAVIMFWVMRRIKKLTRRISSFSEETLGMKPEDIPKGDQLHILEERFQHLTEEVVEARELLKREAEGKTRLIVNNAFDAIITMDADGVITTWNPQAEVIFGWRREEAVGREVTDAIIIPPEYRGTREKAIKQFLSRGEGPIFRRQIEMTVSHRDGHEFPIEVSVSPAQLENKQVFIAIIRDITERKKAEEQIKASLKEKEVLLQEIHHRVKNNMQVISSLLRLQAGETRDKREEELLRDSRNRIKSMALIHEKLYQSKDLSHINFNDYVGVMVKSLYRSYGVDTGKIALKIESGDISIGIDTAIPCGLIVNELVSNALKYAFPEGKKGEVNIALRKSSGDALELIVSDNGAGIPEGVDFRNTGSLGLRLVVTLAENQLQGKIKYNRAKGTEFKIRFKEIKYAERT